LFVQRPVMAGHFIREIHQACLMIPRQLSVPAADSRNKQWNEQNIL